MHTSRPCSTAAVYPGVWSYPAHLCSACRSAAVVVVELLLLAAPAPLHPPTPPFTAWAHSCLIASSLHFNILFSLTRLYTTYPPFPFALIFSFTIYWVIIIKTVEEEINLILISYLIFTAAGFPLLLIKVNLPFFPFFLRTEEKNKLR